MTTQYAIAALNFLLCGVCGVICVCRLNAMNSSFWPVRQFVKLEYKVWIGALTFSAYSPWIGEWPGYASIVVDISILVALLASSRDWANDTPPTTATDFSTLD